MAKSWISISGDTPQAKLAAVALKLKLEDKPLEWTRPGIGPVWQSKGDEFIISAFRSSGTSQGTGTAFHLKRQTFLEGCYPTLQEAKAAAEIARLQTMVVVRAQEHYGDHKHAGRGVVGRKSGVER